MVYLRFAPEARLTPEQLVESVRGDGIRLSPREVDSMRLVTHYWVDDAAVAKVIAAFERHLGST
jgi:hypothetical protein